MTHWKRHWSETQTISPETNRKKEEDPVDEQHPFTSARSAEHEKRPQKAEHRYLTTPEAAHYVRLSERTLERLRLDGTGPRYKKAGPGKRARVLYDRDDLIAWLDGSSFASTSEYGR
ncbi:MAG: helix-turn-helix domain-containing protein [Alphaproteobacteria bacterium]|nr:helix-turn-helix domain-containing protein [Alphaproteobacteria bacterium]